MENVVYFLGAGFSAPLGLPVMSNFLEKAKDIYFVEKNEKDEEEIFKKAFQLINDLHQIKSYLNTDLSNIEEVLSIITMRDQIKKQNEDILFTDFIIKVIKYYQDQINFKIIHEDNFVKKRKVLKIGKSILKSYEVEKLFGLFILSLFNVSLNDKINEETLIGALLLNKTEKTIKKKYSIITLNYDTIIENFINKINELVGEIKFSIALNYNSRGGDFSTVKFLKLHGCIEKRNIIPPTWSKIFNHEEKISNDWKIALKTISEAQHIRFIGYSLPETDSYIKYLFKSAMIESYHLKTVDVICIDKDGEVKRRYEDFIPRNKLKFYNGSFEEILKYFYANRYDKIIRHDYIDSGEFEEDYLKFRGMNFV